MSQSAPFDEAGPPEVLPVPRGHPVLAWLAILVVIVGIPVLRSVAAEAKAESTQDRITPTLLQVQARYLVGAQNFLGGSKPSPLYGQAGALNAGPPSQRFRFIVLAGELAGPREASEQTQQLQEKLDTANRTLTEEENRTLGILRRIYSDYQVGRFDAPSVGDPDRTFLREQLGWFGELALAPPQGLDKDERDRVLRPAYRTFGIILGVFMVGAGLAFLGFVALILWLINLAVGGLKRRMHTGVAEGGIYAETFALWMFLYLGLSIVGSLIPAGNSQLLLSGLAFVLSLTALAWPVFRSQLSWQEVREQIGLVGGTQPLLEPLVGIFGYLMALPIVCVGILATIVLVFLQSVLQAGRNPADEFAPLVFPAHPVVEMLVGPDWWPKIQVLLIASIVAPIVEETMFRGVLYRHLREGTSGLGTGMSVFVSALVVSFVFAVIHPQGLVAVPALMSLAFAFGLLREWRGSLISAIVAHGINNTLVLTLAILLLSG